MYLHVLTSPNPAAASALSTLLDESGFPAVWFMSRDRLPTVAVVAPRDVVASCADAVAALFDLGVAS